MKRIVTFVVPISDGDAIDSGGHSAGHGQLHGGGEETLFDPSTMPAGTLRVEVVVSESQASRIMSTIMSQGNPVETARPAASSPVGDLLETLIRQELEEATADSDNLLQRVVQRVEKQLISQVYSDCDHVKSRAAMRLGINRNTLLKKLRQFGELIEDEEAATADEPNPVD